MEKTAGSQKSSSDSTGIKRRDSAMFVIQDIIAQYIIGIVLCTIIFIIWKIGHKGEKL